MNKKPRVLIVSPALADANNGNWRTASRWGRFLSGVAEVQIARGWDGAACDAMIALHARRSAEAIAQLSAARPACPIALVLTGTDVYRDIEENETARHSLQCASQLVVLQPDALDRLGAAERAKSRVILQSASRLRRRAASRSVDLVAVGHLREEKDPLTLMAAARRLPADTPIRIVHIGEALAPELGEAARRTMAECPHYRWLGGLPREAARRWIARARALVHMSRMEGGAQAVIEAVRSDVPVLASRIGGNLGLLGADYEGYFPVGDAAALAVLMQRFAAEPAFATRLAAQCALREPLFTPEAERECVRRLLRDLLAPP
ncbi:MULTISPECIES: selenoneine biosynthesis selenosugar synthase SenB [unclassified Variovorax]|uniref:selenoneine biosynthesis selenosugar synthase SenB n=1 Tax=unclassified Variovorax TaxID=663243 RepID=UPI00076CACA2|nr:MULTISPECIES: selenoneine biosynthesis selenosugar synthase SenB [unclassified Variovorax]KWT97919.1 Glycosyl transferase, group 1 [Variovorax sp. WDL1]